MKFSLFLPLLLYHHSSIITTDSNNKTTIVLPKIEQEKSFKQATPPQKSKEPTPHLPHLEKIQQKSPLSARPFQRKQ